MPPPLDGRRRRITVPSLAASCRPNQHSSIPSTPAGRDSQVAGNPQTRPPARRLPQTRPPARRLQSPSMSPRSNMSALPGATGERICRNNSDVVSNTIIMLPVDGECQCRLPRNKADMGEPISFPASGLPMYLSCWPEPNEKT
ncbi:uncharacterized protein LOC119270348 [Triticum dicoccoides]|uniref:uncharacterized protein LOC119270348 n=1 Tax=Triticum dicoccoides TaxID=85692 RepID=UPI00188FD727|nr:uncharacterized protein LOC119270348 [Triticum dicoccoides]